MSKVAHDVAVRPQPPQPQQVWERMAAFVQFMPEDVALIRQTGAVLAPHADAVIDAVYEHLFKYPEFARFFQDESGNVPPTGLMHRKSTLKQWLVRTVSGEFDEGFTAYLTRVGAVHTAGHGAHTELHVPVTYMVALMAWVQGAVTATLFQLMGQQAPDLSRAVQAWNKLLMLQLILFLSAYTPEV